MSQTTPTEPSNNDRADSATVAYRIASRSAAVALVFSLVVCALLCYDYSRRRADDPLEAAPIKALKLAAALQPDNEELTEQIRTLDLQLREEYFRQRQFSAMGGWLLLGGVAAFLIAAKTAATLRRKLPLPELATTRRDVEAQWTRIGRWAVAGLLLVLVAVGVGLSFANRSALPESPDELAALLESASSGGQSALEEPSPPPPSKEEIRKWWPRFRGPGGLGISAYPNVPDSWDDRSGKNILWKEPVPLPGYNSPVVWADRVFLSGATEDRREVYCFDANTGELLWQKKVPDTPQGRAEMKEPEFTGYAAPTTVTDGRWIFAVFANGDVAAFDYEGKLAWVRGLGIPENPYGHAASLAMFKNLLLVQFDQAGRKDGKSKLLALDVTNNGRTAWEVKREVPSSWASPIVIHHTGPLGREGQATDQIITCADPWVIAYAPADGAELWRAKVLRQDVGPSPTFADGVLYVVNDFPQLSAIRPDGEGDVSSSHVLWIGEDGLPNTCSPVASEKYVFLLTDGLLTCYDAKTGEMLWGQYEAFDGVTFTSSPSLVGGRVYLFGEVEKEGEEDAEGNPVMSCRTWIVKPGREGCEIIGTCELDEGCVTSPAFQDGRIYIRGAKHLFCIGQKAPESKAQSPDPSPPTSGNSGPTTDN